MAFTIGRHSRLAKEFMLREKTMRHTKHTVMWQTGSSHSLVIELDRRFSGRPVDLLENETSPLKFIGAMMTTAVAIEAGAVKEEPTTIAEAIEALANDTV